MKTEAETGVIEAQGKEIMELPDTERSQEEFPPRAFRGSITLSNLDFGLLDFTPVKQYVSVVLSKKNLW